MSLADAFVGLVKTVAARGRIERLLQQLGWSIDGRKGKALALNFSSGSEKRAVYIANGDEQFVVFAAYSKAQFDAERVPGVATNYALFQNDESPFGQWGVFPEGDDLCFRLNYTAIGDGLTPAILKMICESMVKTTGEFDTMMRQKGYL